MKETLMTAGFNTVLGIGTVFVMLIVMSLIIYCFRIIPMIQDKLAGKPAVEEPNKNSYVPPASAPVAHQEESVDVSDDLALIAIISAAIAASEQIPIDGFRVRTIKRRR